MDTGRTKAEFDEEGDDSDFDETESRTNRPSTSDAQSIAVSQASSTNTGRRLPSHLQRFSAAPSASSQQGAPSTTARSLPPHLSAAASSISTATTVRNDCEARQQGKQLQFTEYHPDGGRTERTAVRTATSTTFSDTSRGQTTTSSSRQTTGGGWNGAQVSNTPTTELQHGDSPN